MALGPVQLVVAGFDRPDHSADVLAALGRLRGNDSVRVIDVLLVRKDADGSVERADHPALADHGDVLTALLGFDEGDGDHLPPGEDTWSLDESIPPGSAAVIALVEHRWAIGTRDALDAAGGVAVAEAWVHPDDLAAVGLVDR